MHRNPLCACYIPLPLPSNLMHLKTCMRMCNGLLKGICAFRRWMFYMCWPVIMLKSYNKDFFVSKQYLNLIVSWRELFVYDLAISRHSIFSTLMSYTNMLWRSDWHFIVYCVIFYICFISILNLSDLPMMKYYAVKRINSY